MPFFLILSLMALFCGAVGMEDLKAHLLLIFCISQRPDPKEKQVINLDQDVQVCGYFWWMVYEPLCMNHLFFSFFLERGYLFLFLSFFFLTCLSMWHTFFGYASFILCSFFYWHAEACGIPSLGMHLLFFFLHSPISLMYFWERGVIHRLGVLFCGWMKFCLLLV